MSGKTIIVKTKRDPFQQAWARKKLSELRLDDDKDYCIGDTLIQREWKPTRGEFTGREIKAVISAITRLAHWVPDVDHRWVILHLDPETFERSF